MPMSAKTLESRFALAKVLVVDDEPGMRKVVRALLLSIGVQNIYEAAGASRGLELVRSKAPHVVILDWEMPGLDGACFMRFLRSAGSVGALRRTGDHAVRPQRTLARHGSDEARRQ